MKELDFNTAFKYPFNRMKGLLNIFWMFLPIIGWFVLGGYSIRIVQEFSKGKFKQVPTLKFSSDLKLGFFMFLKALPFTLAYLAIIFILVKIHPSLRFIMLPFELLALPILVINFMNKETVNSFFEFNTVKSVFNNFGDYIVVLLKSILLAVIFLLMSLILVGIPAQAFTKNIFLADFYRRRVK